MPIKVAILLTDTCNFIIPHKSNHESLPWLYMGPYVVHTRTCTSLTPTSYTNAHYHPTSYRSLQLDAIHSIEQKHRLETVYADAIRQHGNASMTTCAWGYFKARDASKKGRRPKIRRKALDIASLATTNCTIDWHWHASTYAARIPWTCMNMDAKARASWLATHREKGIVFERVNDFYILTQIKNEFSSRKLY